MDCPNCSSTLVVEEADDLQIGEDDQDTVLVDYTRCTNCNCKFISEGDQIILIESGDPIKRSNQI